MIFGIGTDVCDIRRIRASLARRGERFAAKVLGPAELAVYRSRSARSEERGITYVATRFAAKEAFSKALGTGIHYPMTCRACEILNDPSGQPQVQLSGELATWFTRRQLRAHVSMSDERDYATAFVVIEHDSAPSPSTSDSP